MDTETGISLLLDHRHDVRMAAALAGRAGITRVWTTPDRALEGDDLIGVICRPGDITPRTARSVWIRQPWSDSTRALVADLVRAGREVSADADADSASAGSSTSTSAAGILAEAATPVLSLPTLAATLRCAAAVSAMPGPTSPAKAAAVIAVSPGRTSAEAHARVRLDPEFAHTASATCTIVGTLEDCQQAVAALFASGITDVRVSIPATPDFPDVLAQLATLRGDVLRRVEPGAPRSDAPAPPRGWGGRP
ncbi:MAG TPA: hypothetical protein VIN65_10035 [Candidatus Dormibacteraeota bacterium]